MKKIVTFLVLIMLMCSCVACNKKDIYDVFGEQLLKYERFITRQCDVLKLKREAYYISNAILADFIL